LDFGQRRKRFEEIIESVEIIKRIKNLFIKFKTMITWNEVTRFSQIAAIVLFVAVFGLGFLLGKSYENKTSADITRRALNALPLEYPLRSSTFKCDNNKMIEAKFFADRIRLVLSDGRTGSLPKAISQTGARYTSASEHFTFYTLNKDAFILEGTTTTYKNCVSS
jgi:membrane-bound inhibitor of C-type lysozyme